MHVKDFMANISKYGHFNLKEVTTKYGRVQSDDPRKKEILQFYSAVFSYYLLHNKQLKQLIHFCLRRNLTLSRSLYFLECITTGEFPEEQHFIRLCWSVMQTKP